MTRASTYWLVRHGITEVQREGRYCGASDPPLGSVGIEQMLALRPRVPAGLPVVTSARLRALQSAALLAPHRNPIVLPELNEMDFGEWEGKRFEEAGCADPELLNNFDFQFPGGESARLLWQRVARAVDKLPPGGAVVLAHRGSLAALALLCSRLPWDEFWSFRLDHGEMTIMAVAGGVR